MAILVMTGKLPEASLFFEFDDDFLVAVKSAKTPFLLSAGEQIAMKLSGTGFTYDPSKTLIDGQLGSVIFSDGAGDVVYAKLTNVKFNFSAYPDQNPLDGEAFLEKLLSGNDKITGSRSSEWLEGFDGKDRLFGLGGHDLLRGGAGKDFCTGGGGVDAFVIGTDEGNDVIYDFDAVGGGRRQDFLIPVSGESVEFVKDGPNVLVIFDGITTVTLMDVRKVDVGAEDFTAL